MTRPPDDWDDDERRAIDALGPELETLRERHRDDPPFELLRAARAGALPDALQTALSFRLESSAWSRALVDGAESEHVSLDEIGERRLLNTVRRAAGSRRSSWGLKIWLPAVVAAALVLVAVAVLRRGEPTRPGASPSTVTTERRPVPSETPVPAFVLPLEKPQVKLTALALVLRSGGRDGRFVDDIAPAVAAYRRGDYGEANRQFEGLAPRYPRSVEIPFYRGVSQLLLGDAGAAIQSLKAARRLDDETFATDIAWYLAVALERSGDLAAARAELAPLCAASSPYRARACEAAEKLQK
jgi:hypothetical protein